jgi:hypothetical protein
MTTEPVDTRRSIGKRSLVRVKAATLFVVFFSCWCAVLWAPHWHSNAVFLVAAVAAVLVYFVRCESCHSSIYYRAGSERSFFADKTALLMLVGKQCPICGLKRT